MCRDCDKHIKAREKEARAKTKVDSDVYSLAVTLVQEQNNVDRATAINILNREVREVMGRPPRTS